MTAPTAPSASLAAVALGDLVRECATTRRVLERAPLAEHAAWRPHARSMSLGDLCAHLANIPNWGVVTLATEGLDFAGPMPPRAPIPTTAEELVAVWDDQVSKFTAALDAADDAALGTTWTARSGEHVAFAMPRSAVLRQLVVSHMIHHRAQLAVYLRLLDVPVPAIYGNSADER